jgi:serine/threonine protein kinase
MFHIANSTGPPPMPAELTDELRGFLLACFERDPKRRPDATQLLRHGFVRGALDPGATDGGAPPSLGASLGPVPPPLSPSSKRATPNTQSPPPTTGASAVYASAMEAPPTLLPPDPPVPEPPALVPAPAPAPTPTHRMVAAYTADPAHTSWQISAAEGAHVAIMNGASLHAVFTRLPSGCWERGGHIRGCSMPWLSRGMR